MPSILSTSDWSKVHDICLKADVNTWVIWDVDNTLVFAALCVHDDFYKKQLKLIEESEHGKLSNFEIKELWYKIRFSLPCYLMDKVVPVTINDLQLRQIVTFALTYLLARTQNFDCVSWRIQQLRQFNIDFSVTSPINRRVEFRNMSHDYPVGYPTLKDGVFCTHHCQKGNCLELLIEQVDIKPKKIIFIDDALNNLKGVEQIAEKHCIDFLGIEYLGYLNINPNRPCLDETLLNRWKAFKKTGKWNRIPVLR